MAACGRHSDSKIKQHQPESNRTAAIHLSKLPLFIYCAITASFKEVIVNILKLFLTDPWSSSNLSKFEILQHHNHMFKNKW